MTAALHHLGSEIANKYQTLAGKDVYSAIESASFSTGVDFAYLLEQAQAESNFDTDVKAKTSSATGLFQFIDNTWLQTVAKHGYKHGLGHLAQEINFDPKSGKATVSSAQMKKQILELRKDPEIASKMAAEFAKDNQQYLEQKTNADIGSTEMYLAHFLGAGGAAKFINEMHDNPSQRASGVFPQAASANKGVFYNANGTPRNLEQVYAFFDKKFSDQSITPQAPKNPVRAPVMPDLPNMLQAGDEIRYAENTQKSDSVMDAMSMDLASGTYHSYTPSSSFAYSAGAYDLHRTVSEIDVMLLSRMIQQWTHEDTGRGYDIYRSSGSFA